MIRKSKEGLKGTVMLIKAPVQAEQWAASVFAWDLMPSVKKQNPQKTKTKLNGVFNFLKKLMKSSVKTTKTVSPIGLKISKNDSLMTVRISLTKDTSSKTPSISS